MEIEGVVNYEQGKPAAGVTVVLIPEIAERARLDLFREVQTDQNGHFILDTALDGRYSLFAWEDVERGAWGDPDFLSGYASKGVPVTVDEGKRSQIVDLRVLKVVER